MHHTIARMQKFNKEFTNAKACYKKMQQAYLASKNKFAFFPVQHASLLDMSTAIAYEQTRSDPFSEKGVNALKTLNQLYLFGTWRYTLGIYCLDDEIIKDSKAIPDDTPTSIFLNLPEWCVYLDIASAKIAITQDNKTRHIKGFWAVYDLIEYNSKPQKAINFIIDTDSDDDIYLPLTLILDDDMTVMQSLSYADNNIGDGGSNELIKILLPYLLWLCVAEPEIMHKGEPVSRANLDKPKYQTNKKTGVFIPPSEPFIYEVGSRLGGEIRHYQEQIEQGKHRQTSKKRPHIRRGHWHGHWHGTGQAKEFKIKWQPAIFVNAGV